MSILLNKKPELIYVHKDEDIKKLKYGNYAWSIAGSRKNSSLSFSILIFKDVDQHIDGNGLSLLWLIEGEGIFSVEEQYNFMKSGDVLIFNDKQKHGFKSDVVSKAISISIDESFLNLDQKKLTEKICHTLLKVETIMQEESEVWKQP